LNYRWSSKFNEIKNKAGLLNAGANLTVLFNHIRNAYEAELKDKGLVGLYKFRKLVLAQINDLNISKLYKREGQFDEAEVQASLKNLYIFKDILSNLRCSVETFMVIKTILSFICNASFIPLFVVSFLFLVRKLVYGFSILFSLLFTGTYAGKVIIYKYNDKVNTIMETMRDYSLKFHNWFFSDHLVSQRDCVATHEGFSLPYILIPNVDPVKHSYWSYLSDWIDWNLVGYTAGALVIVGTSWAIYSGAVDPIPLAKRAWAFAIAYFSSSSGDDADGRGGDSGDSEAVRDIGVEDRRTERPVFTYPTMAQRHRGSLPEGIRLREEVNQSMGSPSPSYTGDDESSGSLTPRAPSPALVPSSHRASQGEGSSSNLPLLAAQDRGVGVQIPPLTELQVNIKQVVRNWGRMDSKSQRDFATQFPDKYLVIENYIKDHPSLNTGIDRYNILDRIDAQTGIGDRTFIDNLRRKSKKR